MTADIEGAIDPGWGSIGIIVLPADTYDFEGVAEGSSEVIRESSEAAVRKMTTRIYDSIDAGSGAHLRDGSNLAASEDEVEALLKYESVTTSPSTNSTP